MIEIIPAMDLIGGRCVRLVQGDFERRTLYSDDPVETSLRFEASGLRRLHMVDLDGARSGEPCNLDILRRIALATSLVIDYGGGIRSVSDVDSAFAAGANLVNIGSLAVRDPDTLDNWIERFGPERFLIGADSRDGMIAIDGWHTETSVPVIDLIHRFAVHEIGGIFVTDIAKDGAMAGPAVELYREILKEVPGVGIIASGGVRSIQDIEELEKAGCRGVIIGRALYEGTIRLEDLKKYAR
ncbi:MAG: 1-(5-phosphoribosyl)-5-[(5-phosphoribosylamino)methylideneamino]imidazole-4-carboxamide isomerase [Pyrinomonadaceae bacterium]